MKEGVLISDYDIFIGLGLMFGLAFLFNRITFNSIIGFLAFLLIFNGIIYLTGFIPLWSLVLNLIITTSLIILKIRGRDE